MHPPFRFLIVLPGLATATMACATAAVAAAPALADQLAAINAQIESPQATVQRDSEALNTTTETLRDSASGTTSDPTLTTTAANTPIKAEDDGRWNDRQKHLAIGASLGSFHWGYYSLYDGDAQSFRSCSAWTFCGNGLFGGIASIDLTQRLLQSGSLSLDLDASIGIGHQTIRSSWYKAIPTAQQSQTFGLLSVVPMMRLRFPGRLRPLSFGLGAGLSYAIGSIPYEYPYDIPLMSAINAELAYQFNRKSKQEVFLSLRHRCALFGSLNKIDGAQVGSQWYMLGVRSWF